MNETQAREFIAEMGRSMFDEGVYGPATEAVPAFFGAL